jgi:hypothetical protein
MPVVLLLLVHAGVTCALAGLVWVVQLVVYPAFLVVGAVTDEPGWRAFHDAHSRRMALLVTAPWAVQGGTLAALLVRGDGPAWLLALTALCALTTVGVTAGVSVPLHQRLTAYDPGAAQRLLRTNWWRTAAWTLGAGCSLLLVWRG